MLFCITFDVNHDVNHVTYTFFKTKQNILTAPFHFIMCVPVLCVKLNCKSTFFYANKSLYIFETSLVLFQSAINNDVFYLNVTFSNGFWTV